jgi:hypothetical protein
MRAISLWQPWGSLIFARLKKFETRHWPTFYRGPLAIHAAQRPCPPIDDLLVELCCDTFGQNWRAELPRGRMLGIVDLVECKSTEAYDVDAIEQLCGNWAPGRYAWRLEEPRVFADPPLAKGRQSFFDWDHTLAVAVPPEQARLL